MASLLLFQSSLHSNSRVHKLQLSGIYKCTYNFAKKCKKHRSREFVALCVSLLQLAWIFSLLLGSDALDPEACPLAKKPGNGNLHLPICIWIYPWKKFGFRISGLDWQMICSFHMFSPFDWPWNFNDRLHRTVMSPALVASSAAVTGWMDLKPATAPPISPFDLRLSTRNSAVSYRPCCDSKDIQMIPSGLGYVGVLFFEQLDL